MHNCARPGARRAAKRGSSGVGAQDRAARRIHGIPGLLEPMLELPAARPKPQAARWRCMVCSHDPQRPGWRLGGAEGRPGLLGTPRGPTHRDKLVRRDILDGSGPKLVSHVCCSAPNSSRPFKEAGAGAGGGFGRLPAHCMGRPLSQAPAPHSPRIGPPQPFPGAFAALARGQARRQALPELWWALQGRCRRGAAAAAAGPMQHRGSLSAVAAASDSACASQCAAPPASACLRRGFERLWQQAPMTWAGEPADAQHRRPPRPPSRGGVAGGGSGGWAFAPPNFRSDSRSSRPSLSPPPLLQSDHEDHGTFPLLLAAPAALAMPAVPPRARAA